ncbi:MAG: acyl-CoA dehydrogenase [Hyphomicrobiaceae bacterium]|nr:MAG: acyl-CoA dehydrogenase [Hyphomicrobiaceae bacterium]
MNFELGENQQAVVDGAARICAQFDDAYWLTADREGRFPHEFHARLAESGWLGITMPEQFGGAGLGVFEAALMMKTIAGSGGGMAAASSVHINLFGPHPIVVHGTEEQKQRWLPPLIAGREKTCFGVTEPDAGLDTTRIKTFAERMPGGYTVHGQKIWTSTAQQAQRIMLLARTTPREQCSRKTLGLSLFYTALDRTKIEVREIEKMGRKAVDSNQLFIDGLFVPEEDRIGEEGRGFTYLLDSLNPERILIGMEAIGIGQDALRRAARYAGERVVFERPIGANQSIQHPLAESWMELEAATLMGLKAAWLYDNKRPCGAEANAGKFLGAEAAFKACTAAVKTHGGMGYAKEFHVERLLREVMIPVLTPVSPQMILNYIAERVLGLPRSY